jgi:hypothetical protein
MPRTRPLMRASTNAPSDKRLPRPKGSAGGSAIDLTICPLPSRHAFEARKWPRYRQ